jgi:hypothetical protein
MNNLIRHQLSLAIRQFRANGTPREWTVTTLGCVTLAVLLVAIYILL